jgi:hypothetical protein
MNKLILLFTIASFVFTGCKDDEPDDDPIVKDEVRLSLSTNYDGQSFDLNTFYQTQEGYSIQFTKLNFIFSHVKNGSAILCDAAVYKFENNASLIWQGEGDYTKFSSITGNVGVGPDENHLDPSSLALTNPLNIQNTGDMHWGWNPGYIFLMIEGKADTTAAQTGVYDMNFLYHVGMDPLLRTFSLPTLNWVKKNDNLHEAVLALDMSKIFNGTNHTVDIKQERSSHTMPGQEPLSTKIIENFVEALTVQ